MPDVIPGPDLPVGTVVTIGHPGNGRLAARARDGWRDLRAGAPLVDPEDFRAGWAIVGRPAAPVPQYRAPLPASRHNACPDEGACHHACLTVCYRTRMAGPGSLWLRKQGRDPEDPKQWGWPEGIDVRPRDRRAARDEFCHHSKGENGATVPPCLRTLDEDGCCPVHGGVVPF